MNKQDLAWWLIDTLFQIYKWCSTKKLLLSDDTELWAFDHLIHLQDTSTQVLNDLRSFSFVLNWGQKQRLKLENGNSLNNQVGIQRRFTQKGKYHWNFMLVVGMKGVHDKWSHCLYTQIGLQERIQIFKFPGCKVDHKKPSNSNFWKLLKGFERKKQRLKANTNYQNLVSSWPPKSWWTWLYAWSKSSQKSNRLPKEWQ